MQATLSKSVQDIVELLVKFPAGEGRSTTKPAFYVSIVGSSLGSDKYVITLVDVKDNNITDHVISSWRVKISHAHHFVIMN